MVPFFESFSAVFRKVSFRFGRGIRMMSNRKGTKVPLTFNLPIDLVRFARNFFVLIFLASPGISVMYFWSLFIIYRCFLWCC